MQHDEVIWQVINSNFCSFKIKTVTQNFCRNEYNVTGLCSRKACPLANSRYATVRELRGQVYLYMKTAERAHTPNQLWERIKLSKQYSEALKQIDKELEFWPSIFKHRCKQRLTKITQYLIRMRKMKLKSNTVKHVPIKRRIDRREAKRESKAEVAAHLDKVIAAELVERLKSGNYDDVIFNAKESVWKKVLESEHVEAIPDAHQNEDTDEEEDEEYIEASDDDEMEREFIEMEDGISDMEDLMEEDELPSDEEGKDDLSIEDDVSSDSSNEEETSKGDSSSKTKKSVRFSKRLVQEGKPKRRRYYSPPGGGHMELEYEHILPSKANQLH